ncbi:MAG: UDP-N-acetylglucosamine--N-acetylmuramyl-(pentapeptide) pyrophosphoryl-undecaprenol N-acetylglucosamine transferase [Acidimicrobiia bacterium]
MTEPVPGTPTVWALICGGGTAGHVLPALAIAGAMVERGHDPSTIHFVGGERGVESTLVPAAGFELTRLPGRGFRRRLSVANLAALRDLFRGVRQGVTLVRRLRPEVVVSVGGYASVPCALAAAVLGVPIVVAEQNARPGAANRLVARFARASAVSFENTALPRPVLTGNPVRPEVLAIDRRHRGRARNALGVEPGRALVLVAGGSLGALRLNHAALEAVQGPWRQRSDLCVRHVVGARDWDAGFEAEARVHGPHAVQYQPLRYEDDMPLALTAADVAVCRSGSSSVFELAAAGVPAVLVPSPNVTGDHQTANARYLEAAGGAVVVADHDFDGDRLAAEVDAILAGPGRLGEMSRAAAAVARPGAADAIAALAETHAGLPAFPGHAGRSLPRLGWRSGARTGGRLRQSAMRWFRR